MRGLVGELEDAHEVGGHGVGVSDRVPLDELQERGRVEALHQHDRPAQAQHGHVEAQRSSVIERRGRQVHGVVGVAVEPAQHRLERVHVALEDAGQRAHDALRLPGGPRAVEHAAADVLHVEWRGGLIGECVVVRGAEHQVLVHARARLECGLGGCVHPWRAHHHSRVAVVDDVRDLGRGEMRVDRRVVQPGSLEAPDGHEELRVVLGHQRDVVAHFETARAKVMCELGRALVELAVGDGVPRVPGVVIAHAGHDDRRLVGRALGPQGRARHGVSSCSSNEANVTVSRAAVAPSTTRWS